MRNAKIGFSTLATFLVLAVNAVADGADYSADDIIRHFEAASEPVTRGICIGSDEACGKTGDAKPVSAFDLLVTFEKNSTELTESAQNNLLQFSAALRHPKLSGQRFAVEGFTDASGSVSHNLKLSEARALSVVSFLAELGINPSRLQAKGFGETRMRTADAYDPANRRVETRLLSAP